MFLQRSVQLIKPGCWDAVDPIDKKFDIVEAKYHFPPKRRFRSYMGSHDINTLVIEREWDSLGLMEQAYFAAMADPEWQKLGQEFEALCEKDFNELYLALP
jgi:hypothetical protein